eukprot:1523029-Amphidinium_carterae.2
MDCTLVIPLRVHAAALCPAPSVQTIPVDELSSGQRPSETVQVRGSSRFTPVPSPSSQSQVKDLNRTISA